MTRSLLEKSRWRNASTEAGCGGVGVRVAVGVEVAVADGVGEGVIVGDGISVGICVAVAVGVGSDVGVSMAGSVVAAVSADESATAWQAASSCMTGLGPHSMSSSWHGRPIILSTENKAGFA